MWNGSREAQRQHEEAVVRLKPKRKRRKRKKNRKPKQSQEQKERWLEEQIRRETASANCKQCARCCCANGLVPPYTPTKTSPAWSTRLHNALMDIPDDVQASLPCLFLKNDGRCAVYDVRPRECRQYVCEDCYVTPEL